MVKPAARRDGWTASAILAGLTLFVFFVLQNYGPESAVRRFHQAFLRRDLPALQEVTVEPLNSEPVNAVAFAVSRVLPAVDGYQLRQIERSQRAVLMEIQYIRGKRIVAVLPWYVEKKGSPNWRVNATETLNWMRRYGFL